MSEKPRGFEVLRVSNPVFFCIEAERLINSPSEAEGNGVDHDDTNHICVSHGMCSSTSDFFFFLTALFSQTVWRQWTKGEHRHNPGCITVYDQTDRLASLSVVFLFVCCCCFF